MQRAGAGAGVVASEMRRHAIRLLFFPLKRPPKKGYPEQNKGTSYGLRPLSLGTTTESLTTQGELCPAKGPPADPAGRCFLDDRWTVGSTASFRHRFTIGVRFSVSYGRVGFWNLGLPSGIPAPQPVRLMGSTTRGLISSTS